VGGVPGRAFPTVTTEAAAAPGPAITADTLNTGRGEQPTDTTATTGTAAPAGTAVPTIPGVLPVRTGGRGIRAVPADTTRATDTAEATGTTGTAPTEQPATRTALAAVPGGCTGLTIGAGPGHRGRVLSVLTGDPGAAGATGATGPEEHPTPTTGAADTTTGAPGPADTTGAEPARVTTNTTGTPHTARGGVPAPPGQTEPPRATAGPAVEAVTARARQKPRTATGTRGGTGATQRIKAVAVTDQQPRIRMLGRPIGEQHRQTTEYRTLLGLALLATRSPHHLRRGP
jgi:hypothetical protein